MAAIWGFGSFPVSFVTCFDFLVNHQWGARLNESNPSLTANPWLCSLGFHTCDRPLAFFWSEPSQRILVFRGMP